MVKWCSLLSQRLASASEKSREQSAGRAVVPNMKKRGSHAMVEGMVVPAFTDLNAILEFGRELQKKDQVVLDFSEVGWARPTGMLFLSAIIAEAVDEKKIVMNIGTTANSYEANMGFYEACKIDVPKGNAPGGVTYYPITVHSVVEAQEAAAEKGVPIGEHVNFMVGRLAYLITREARGNLFETIKYSLREIIRNVVEHSESEFFSVMGQYWHTTNEVELAVLDHGIGLRNALEKNPRFLGLSSDLQAIRLALLPSVSGVKLYEKTSEIDAPSDPGGKWGNSGFGLFMTSQIARSSGCFLIGSGDNYLSLCGPKKSYFKYGIPGTMISMSMNVAHLKYLESRLKEISDRGERFAKRHLSSGKDVMASAASKLIMQG